jgi:hypothetical protein
LHEFENKGLEKLWQSGDNVAVRDATPVVLAKSAQTIEK